MSDYVLRVHPIYRCKQRYIAQSPCEALAAHADCASSCYNPADEARIRLPASFIMKHSFKVCLAAHSDSFIDGHPQMSNFYGLPG
jgi:hypothetical protein